MKDLLTYPFLLEFIAATSSIVYSLLLMKEKISGWAFGILSSVASVLLYYHNRVYGQSLISIYYAGVGVYGWLYWKRAQLRNEHIHTWRWITHLKALLLFSILSVALWYLLHTYTDASNPVLDSFLTVFGVLASIKEARKILTSWVYWFVINILTAWLCYDRELYYYALLMLVYAVICIPGYLNWKRILDAHPATTKADG